MSDSKTDLKKTLLLSLGALGVVFGDIGTSPLYSVKEIVLHLGEAARNPANVLGYISLVIWTLIIIIAFKYIILVMRADNEGEGGVFAVYALLQKVNGGGKLLAVTSLLLLLAVGMLYGDGIITPAISVISAIEGLAFITTWFEPFIVPITLAILTGLFLIQSRGTHKIGAMFGPIIILWFVCISLLGIPHILANPGIFLVFNPLHAIQFLSSHNPHTIFLVLGSVMLAVTGGEALYADMGHFGKSPIRIGWFSVAFPALIINYLGQGAFLLGDSPIVNHNVFFSMSPAWAITPLVLLATTATIIASQALITGAYSLAIQGISLGLIPMLKVVHTHEDHEGQIYVPMINQVLYIGCVLLVVIFKSSTNLASAYGLAVSSVMLVTTISIYMIAKKSWHWSSIKSLIVFIPLLTIDFIFLAANSIKFFRGGYIPLLIGISMLIMMLIWKWGKQFSTKCYKKITSITIKELIDLKKKSTTNIPRTYFVMTQFPPKDNDSLISAAGQIVLDRQGLIPYHVVFLTVATHRVPYMHQERYSITNFYQDETKGSVTGLVLHYGFMERPMIEPLLEELAEKKIINIHNHRKEWLMSCIKKRFFFYKSASFFKAMLLRIYKIMYFKSKTLDEYYGLGNRIRLIVNILPIKNNH